MAVFTDEIVATDEYLFSDLIKCCSFFLSDKKIYNKNNFIGDEIWDLTLIADLLVKNHANRNVIKNIFETICIFEKSVPSSGVRFLHNLIKPSPIDTIELRASSSFIFNQVSKIINCDKSKEILALIKKHGNPSLSINVNRLPVLKPTIRFSNYPKVKLRVAEGFLPKVNSFTNCGFLMVDGSLSSASELSHLMNKSFEDKDKTFFLVCKSFNDQILFTLSENYHRGLINIIPIQYGFDLESINSLPDLVSVIGGLPLSPTLGDLINNTDDSRLGNCDECKIDGKFLTIKSGNVSSAHKNRIIKKIENQSSVETKELLSKRLSLLNSNTCKITLPTTKRYDSIERNIVYSVLLLKEMFQNHIHQYFFGKQKFYVSKNAFKIQNELDKKIKDLLKTKIFLPRKKNGKI